MKGDLKMDYKTLYELFMEKKKENSSRWDYKLILEMPEKENDKAMGAKQHED